MNRYGLRTTWLFGKPYWWDRDDQRRLTLRPAPWLPDIDGA